MSGADGGATRSSSALPPGTRGSPSEATEFPAAGLPAPPARPARAGSAAPRCGTDSSQGVDSRANSWWCFFKLRDPHEVFLVHNICLRSLLSAPFKPPLHRRARLELTAEV